MAKPNCTIRNKKLQRVKDTATFIEKAKSIHGYRYDYRLCRYKDTLTKVCIICHKHGEFWQQPRRHLKGNGCKDCSSVAPKGTSTFVRQAKAIHGDLYSYEKVDYINGTTEVEITCKTHGVFLQKPVNHLRGNGCKRCYTSRIGDSQRLTTSEFISKAKKVHKGFYSYEKTKYINSATKVVITCPEHGDFKQSPNKHANKGSGCPKCRPKGWHKTGFVKACNNNSGIGRLYAIKCFNDDELFYKTGITSQELEIRFSGNSRMPYKHIVLFEVVGKPDYIYDLETQLHRMLRGSKYRPNKLFAGRTECFTTIKPVEPLLKKLATTKQLCLLT